METASPITIVATPAQYGGKPKRVRTAGGWRMAKPQPIAVKVDPASRRFKTYRLDSDGWVYTGRGRWVDGSLAQPANLSPFPEDRYPGEGLPILSKAARTYLAAAIGKALEVA